MQWHVRFQFFRCREQAYCSSGLMFYILETHWLKLSSHGQLYNTAAKIRATHFRLSSCAIRANSNIVLGTTLLIFSAWFLSQHLGIKFDFQLNWLSKLPRHGQFRFLRLIIAVSKSTLLLCESTFASSLISRPDVWSSKNLSNFKRSRLVFRGTVMSTHAPMKRLGFEFFTQHR